MLKFWCKGRKHMSFRRDKDKKVFEFVNGKGLFYDGLAAVKLNDGSGYSYVDTFGNIWDERYDQTQDFVGGMAVVRLRDGRESYFCLIDTDGHYLREDGRYKISSECIFNQFDKGYAQFMNIVDRSCYVTRNGYVLDEKYDSCDLLVKTFDSVIGAANEKFLLEHKEQLTKKSKLLEALLFECEFRLSGKLGDKFRKEAYSEAATLLASWLKEKEDAERTNILLLNEREM